MRVLLLMAYYYPEQISSSQLDQDLISGFIESGMDVQIVCPIPTRACSEEDAKKYSKIKEETLYDGRLKVRRFWAPKEKRNAIQRAVRYLWCGLRMFFVACRIKDFDLVLTDSTPPTQGLIGGWIAKHTNVPFAYIVQDVFPDSLEIAGLTHKGSTLWKIGRRIENATYSKSRKIIVISKSIQRNLVNKNVPIEKLAYIPNWIDIDKVFPVPKEDNRLFDELGLNREFYTVVYAGSFGAMQNTDVICDAAGLFEKKEKIQFVLFGRGQDFDRIKDRVIDEKISNMYVFPMLSLDRVAEVYSMGDCALITCKAGVGSSGMPSKTWSIMACNTPIVASFDKESELSELIRDTRFGVVASPGDATELAEAIRFCRNNHKEKNNAEREYVRQNADRRKCVQSYIDVLKDMKGYE